MVAQKHPEYQYLDLMEDILKNGVKQIDKGTGDVTYSVFGRQIRFDLSKSFPLLTTKKVYWNGVLQELYWFLSGQSNIKYLLNKDILNFIIEIIKIKLIYYISSINLICK